MAISTSKRLSFIAGLAIVEEVHRTPQPCRIVKSVIPCLIDNDVGRGSPKRMLMINITTARAAALMNSTVLRNQPPDAGLRCMCWPVHVPAAGVPPRELLCPTEDLVKKEIQRVLHADPRGY